MLPPREAVPLILDLARPLYRWARHAPDRLLHSRRRAAAAERRRQAGPPASVLVLCYGNICRSPYAEARLRELLRARGRDTIAVSSGGFFGPGRAANEVAQRLAAVRGLDLSTHVSRLVTPAMAGEAPLVLAMTVEQARAAVLQSGARPCQVEVLGDFDPRTPDQRDIPDPYGHPLPVFEQVFDRIDRCLDVLADSLAR